MPRVYLPTGKRTESVRYDSIEISGKFIQIYDDLNDKLFRIGSSCALHLLFWMSMRMDNYNQVSVNKNRRQEFIADCISGGGKRYSDSTVKSALRSLVSSGLVVSMNEKGRRDAMYFVNPFHFWKTGSQKDRTESIKGFIYKIEENEANGI